MSEEAVCKGIRLEARAGENGCLYLYLRAQNPLAELVVEESYFKMFRDVEPGRDEEGVYVRAMWTPEEAGRRPIIQHSDGNWTVAPEHY